MEYALSKLQRCVLNPTRARTNQRVETIEQDGELHTWAASLPSPHLLRQNRTPTQKELFVAIAHEVRDVCRCVVIARFGLGHEI